MYWISIILAITLIWVTYHLITNVKKGRLDWRLNILKPRKWIDLKKDRNETIIGIVIIVLTYIYLIWLLIKSLL